MRECVGRLLHLSDRRLSPEGRTFHVSLLSVEFTPFILPNWGIYGMIRVPILKRYLMVCHILSERLLRECRVQFERVFPRAISRNGSSHPTRTNVSPYMVIAQNSAADWSSRALNARREDESRRVSSPFVPFQNAPSPSTEYMPVYHRRRLIFRISQHSTLTLY